MAAASKRSGNSGISWINSVSDEEQPLVFVRGVNGEGKTAIPFDLKSGSTSISTVRDAKLRTKRFFGGKNQVTQKTGSKNRDLLQKVGSEAYTQDNISAQHQAATTTNTSNACLSFSKVMSETSRAKNEVFLKDLCPEDKHRITNLIRELARVNGEKEESMQRLKDEQGNFERKIQQLEKENLVIAKERESLQQQYRECQELLGLYQQYLSQQQAKLNQSIAQLSQQVTYSQVLSCEEAPSRRSTSRSNGPLFDGSFVSLAAAGGQHSHVYKNGDERRKTAQALRNPTSPPHASELSPNYGLMKQHMGSKTESREPQLCRRCEESHTNGQYSGIRTQRQRPNNCSRPSSSYHDTCNRDESERDYRGKTPSSESKETLTRPSLGQEDWEEKRHQLLLQKMQLEMEREKLQARLAEQEERLNRQSQQLHQSHLDYRSFQQATRAELSRFNTRNEGSEEGEPRQDSAPSVSEDAEQPPAGQNVHGKHSQTVPASSHSENDALKRSRRDVATSPAKSPASLSKPTSVTAVEKTLEARSDLSMVELLDIFTPVPTPEQCYPASRRPKASQHRPAKVNPKSLSRTLLPPAGPYTHSQSDLEESRMLEDIFFIC